MAFSFLQDNGGWGGLGDVSDQSLSSGGSGSGIWNALENIGVNFAAGAANVGVGALANSARVTPSQFAGNSALLGYNSALLTSRPGSISPIGATGISPNTLLLGGALVLGLVAFALFRKG